MNTMQELLHLQLNMDLVLKNFLMVINIVVNIFKVNFMEKENMYGKMEHFMKVNFNKVKGMVLEYGDHQ